MKISAIKPAYGAGSVTVFFETHGATTVGEDELLSRDRFLDRIRQSFWHRGVDDAPPNQASWEAYIRRLWVESNPDSARA